MNSCQQIERFLREVRNRLNRFHLTDSLVQCAAAVAFAALAGSLFYVFRGHSVPAIFLGASALAIVPVALIIWLCRLENLHSAAHYADQYFDLKDSLAAFLAFRQENRAGDFVALQEKNTAQAIAAANPSGISYRWPVRLLAFAIGSFALCGLAALKKPSPQVLEKIRLEEQTAERTQEINQQIEKLVEEWEKNAGDDDKKLIAPTELRQWVKELDQTSVPREALRQYARLERRLLEAAQRLDQRRSEQLVAKAGQELQKDPENRALGKKMEERKLRQAAEELEKMAPSPMTASPEKMSQQRQEMARLKSAALRLASAARDRETTAESRQATDPPDPSATPPSPAPAPPRENSSQLAEAMLNLEKAIRDLEHARRNQQLQRRQAGGELDKPSDSEISAQQESVRDRLADLAGELRQSAAKTEAREKLLALGKRLAQMQTYLSQKPGATLADCLNPGQQAGGQKAGQGSVQTRREAGEMFPGNGPLVQISGSEGEGPSESSVAPSAEGGGVSTRRAAERQLEFSRQIESFVRREDVPEDVKQGVKTYFEKISQSETR